MVDIDRRKSGYLVVSYATYDNSSHMYHKISPLQNNKNHGTKMASKFAPVVGRPTWQQTMLRIKDPKKSIPFYTDVMGMTIIDTLDFPQWNFKLWFLTTLPEGETYSLTPGTKEAHDYMWSIKGTALELTWNYGTEDDPSQKYHPGNQEKDGFGHIAFNTDDVYAACEKLEKAGVSFKKKPDEGRMKGLAFAYDPDGYW
jgi:lactoylglutathione lyase